MSLRERRTSYFRKATTRKWARERKERSAPFAGGKEISFSALSASKRVKLKPSM